jgi:hypothetical protein
LGPFVSYEENEVSQILAMAPLSYASKTMLAPYEILKDFSYLAEWKVDKMS